MKFVSAAVVGVIALALQASAAPLRVDVFVASPATPISLEDALKHTESRPNVPVRISGYGFVHKAGEAGFHPTIQVAEVSDKKTAHWVYRPAAGKQGAVLVADGAAPARQNDEAFRHWVMTHPEVEHGHGRMWLRPHGKQGGCQHKSWKNSFNRLANTVREALGFAPVHAVRPHHQPPHTPDMMFPDIVAVSNNGIEQDDQIMRRPDARWPMPFHHQGQGRHHRFHHHRGGDWHKKPFGRRVMHALYILGPVEGRIVAFVLGLGIGALIRVMFVMGLLAYRSITGRTRRIMLEDDEECETIIVERVFEIKEKEQAPAYTAVVREGEQMLAPPS